MKINFEKQVILTLFIKKNKNSQQRKPVRHALASYWQYRIQYYWTMHGAFYSKR